MAVSIITLHYDTAGSTHAIQLIPGGPRKSQEEQEKERHGRMSLQGKEETCFHASILSQPAASLPHYQNNNINKPTDFSFRMGRNHRPAAQHLQTPQGRTSSSEWQWLKMRRDRERTRERARKREREREIRLTSPLSFPSRTRAGYKNFVKPEPVCMAGLAVSRALVSHSTWQPCKP
ncbi:hypothetical protein CH063_15247 [Colletotrichum higginsianum]|uniref:Uncharacterized protein n=1 Tax=Colletotrichum higginsianum (strain IMI 349063) TaxID=759273 RepID=H1W205_COLHI|nr:hypothetical protein CH063_15247 [Colletotrichum higginsianum]